MSGAPPRILDPAPAERDDPETSLRPQALEEWAISRAVEIRAGQNDE